MRCDCTVKIDQGIDVQELVDYKQIHNSVPVSYKWQGITAVTAYCMSKQLLLFAFALVLTRQAFSVRGEDALMLTLLYYSHRKRRINEIRSGVYICQGHLR